MACGLLGWSIQASQGARVGARTVIKHVDSRGVSSQDWIQ